MNATGPLQTIVDSPGPVRLPANGDHSHRVLGAASGRYGPAD